MKTLCLSLPLILCAGLSAQSATTLRWHGMAGVITTPGIDNPVGQIHSGTQPWTTRGGSARLNLTTGDGSFDVEGLVLNGGSASGTAGSVTSVVGTLVCNVGGAGGGLETAVDTPAAALSPAGNAELSFKINVPSTCNNPLFLIRVAGALRWIATGTGPASAPGSGY
jgi:hypothetical protein